MSWLNFSLSARADSQCVTYCYPQIAALRRSTPNFCANFSLSRCLNRRNQPPSFHVIASQSALNYGMVATGNHWDYEIHYALQH